MGVILAPLAAGQDALTTWVRAFDFSPGKRPIPHLCITEGGKRSAQYDGRGRPSLHDQIQDEVRVTIWWSWQSVWRQAYRSRSNSGP